MKTDLPPPESNRGRDCVSRLVRRLRCTLLGHVVYPCDHSGSSLLRRTEEGVEADCYHCGKTIKATCGLELCGLVWRRKPNTKTEGPAESGTSQSKR